MPPIIKPLIFICYFVLIHLVSDAQNTYPEDYFRSPIDGRIYLSGTFGELRSNHFHTGIDIKTGGVEGKNIYAAADGWVSRIKISPWGYGNAIYIKHPNGYTTVYGHLQKYNAEITEYTQIQQYKEQKFAIDIFPEPHQIQIEKGDIIALSGNSGSSGGPHIHFEIRDSQTQEPLNPFLFGIQVKDYITPVIKSLRIYPAEKGALIQGENKAENFILKGWGTNYAFKNGDSIVVQGDFYTGISTVDKQNDSHNRNGVYSIKIYLDTALFYHHKVERLNFSTNRYINTLIDYNYYKSKKRRYQRSYISPNNKLQLYEHIENNGIFSFNDNKYHLIKYVVKDYVGNTSVLQFTVLSKPLESLPTNNPSNVFSPLIKNTFKDHDLEIDFPAECFYDTTTFSSVQQSSNTAALTHIYHIGHKEVALQKAIQIKIKHIEIPDSIKDKAFLGRVSGKTVSFNTSKWIDQQLVFKTRTFGKYGIFVDSIPPVIKLKTQKSRIKSSNIIYFYVNDKKTGISKYNAWLNGSWIILEWDPKKNRMFVRNNLTFQENNHLLIEVFDNTNNKATLKIDF